MTDAERNETVEEISKRLGYDVTKDDWRTRMRKEDKKDGYTPRHPRHSGWFCD
mgnify:CR=1 FL=1